MALTTATLLGLKMHLAVLRGLHEKNALSATLAQELEKANGSLSLALSALSGLGENLFRLKCGIDDQQKQRPDRADSPTLAFMASSIGRTTGELLFLQHLFGYEQEIDHRQQPQNQTLQALHAHGQTASEEIMQGLNDVTLIGRLGADPALKFGVNSGKPYCHFNLACEEGYTDKEGQHQSHVEWVPVITYGKTAENCAKHLAKGSLVCVKGKVSTSKTQNKDGEDVYSTRIKAIRVLFLGRKAEAGKTEQPAAGEDLGNGEDLGSAFPADASGMDDVPF